MVTRPHGRTTQDARHWRCPALLVLAAALISPAFLPRETHPEPGPPFHRLVDIETSARLLALLLVSGRAVVNENPEAFQSAPAENRPVSFAGFEAQLFETFRLHSGVDLRDLEAARIPQESKRWLRIMVAVSKQVVEDYRRQGGQAPGELDALIPAKFGSRVAARFTELTGVRLKQTSLAPRNPANTPDAFERATLEAFADPANPREQPISEVSTTTRALRLMYPLYTTRQCLACHGSPKGELDKTGYPREGLQLGQNAGAISVVIPLGK
jgi:general secretion pathway protein A